MADRSSSSSELVLLCAAILVLLQCSCCAASAGDRDPGYRSCLVSCEATGCIRDTCFAPCNSSTAAPRDQSVTEVLFSLHKWDCSSECRYHCMQHREAQRLLAGEEPVKYHGKWPFPRLRFIQEPASVALSVLNLVAHMWGLYSFMRTVYHKLPSETLASTGPYYEFCGLWIVYGLFSINCWLWSAVFHTRDIALTERLDYTSANAILGYSLILAVLRVFNIRREEQRVMVAAPIIGFVATHICYINFYELDYGWNTRVGVTMGATQLLLWLLWAGFTKHPSRLKVWTVVVSTFAALSLEVFDFPPLWGYLDAHALWHLVTVPLTLLWWSFVKEDAAFRTSILLKPRKAE